MTQEEKILSLRMMLDVEDEAEDSVLEQCLSLSQNAILGIMYCNYANIPSGADVPAKYDIVQLDGAKFIYLRNGTYFERQHREGEYSVTFDYSDLNSYLSKHVCPIVVIK